jgi:SAM-dependent methyltransferase
MRWLAVVSVVVAALQGRPASDVPFVPTAPEVVAKMLEVANVTKDDVVFDLGCGDGRILIAAATKYGARGVGVDVDAALIERARANAVAAGVADRVTFRVENFFDTDLRSATVVALYLLPSVNARLAPKLRAELRPGTRIVSNSFDMGDVWPADRRVPIGDTAVFLWRVQ